MKGDKMTVVKVESEDPNNQQDVASDGESMYPGHTVGQPLQPDWKNAPTVRQLKGDVDEATPDFNTHISNVSKWLDLRDGRLKIKIPKGQSKMAPKLIRKQNEWRYSSLSEPLLSSVDMFDVKPQTHTDVDSARDNAIILNKQFQVDIDRVGFVDEYVRTAVDEGTVFVRVGWEFEEDEVTRLVPIKKMMLLPEDQLQLDQLTQQAQQMMMQAQGGMIDPMMAQQQMQGLHQQIQEVEARAFEVDTDEFEEITETEVAINKPTLEVCDYSKVMVDPTCRGDLERAQFIVYQFYSSRGELREDPKYSNVEAIITDGENDAIGPTDDEVMNGTFEFKDEPRKKLLVTEYWGFWDIDGDGTTMPIVATYCGSVMIRLEENPFPDQRPPFVKVNYLPKRKSIYGGEPDAVLTEEHQDVIGAVTRGMIDLMGKSANAQQGIAADALDPAQKLRFEQGKDFIFNPGIDPKQAFFMAQYPEIPRSAMEMIQLQSNDAESLTGVKAFSQGITGQALGTTATGVRSAMDATAKRELGILRRLSKGMVQIGEKIIAMNAINLSDEEVIRHTDGEFVTINRDSLDGKYDLNLSISTPEVDQEQAQDLGFMLQTIGPNMDPGLQAKILGKIARLKKMPDLAKQIEDYKPEPDPAQEKIKELEIALLEAQVANEKAQGTENEADTVAKYADADLTKAKTVTENAKTRSLESGSDMTDLQFLQEKDGTKHAQAKDMEASKLSNDLDRKGAESLLSQDTPNTFSSGDGLLGMDTPAENLADSLQA